MKVPYAEKLIQQLASDEDRLVHDRPFYDLYKDYLERQRDSLVSLLVSGRPLSDLDRCKIADLLKPERYLDEDEDETESRGPGRPKSQGYKPTCRRNIRIALEYQQLYSKGCSEAIYLELSEKYGLKDPSNSSVKKAIKAGKKAIEDIRKSYGVKSYRGK